MSLFEGRIALNASINWKAYERRRRQLRARFPGAIVPPGQPKKPLAHGFHRQLRQAGVPYMVAKMFLEAYTFGPKYLEAVIEGAGRIDIEGHLVGTVSAAEAAYSRACLAAHRELARPARRRDDRKFIRQAA